MTHDIDSQVAAFATQLEDSPGLFDIDQIFADVSALLEQIVSAEDHQDAAVAIREFADARAHDDDYARAVILGTLSQLSMHMALAAPIGDLPGENGLLQRLLRVVYAVRGLGMGAL
ncbi:hypothetical protein [Microbacterium caowuchunii]|uniref:Uncharacterized protein n=1 Tax=Microbacterium caowuchunii TaxID=2614638 RepID=A0A5N0TGW8_9MICO|nr:hypothetical protein [Microbacterium caowuchunii]KAA9133714.1 hypothetical protein F6B40_08145 [Microbacterium caowuchunii]